MIFYLQKGEHQIVSNRHYLQNNEWCYTSFNDNQQILAADYEEFIKLKRLNLLIHCFLYSVEKKNKTA